jgi:hypothetical protein
LSERKFLFLFLCRFRKRRSDIRTSFNALRADVQQTTGLGPVVQPWRGAAQPQRGSALPACLKQRYEPVLLE